MTAISVHGLVKRFGRVVAVDDLSFEVQPGTLTGFVGPNGAGKTTTLRMILGLVRPTAGTALIDGVPYARLDRPAPPGGAVLEASGFHPGRTARTTSMCSPCRRASRSAASTTCCPKSTCPGRRGGGSADSRWACASG